MTAEAGASSTDSIVPALTRSTRGGLRTVLAGVAAVLGMLFGAFALPQAAMAQDFEAWVTNGNDPWIQIGGNSHEVGVSIQAKFERGTGPKDVTVSASLGGGLDQWIGFDVENSNGGKCNRVDVGKVTCAQMTADETQQLRFILSPVPESDLTEGETKEADFHINYDGGNVKTKVTVVGTEPARDASVTEITGTVKENAEGVEGAKVEITDPEGGTRDTTTGSDGGFRFQGDEQNYIAPGDIELVITKEGYETLEQTISVNAGSSYSSNFTFRSEAEEAPTAEATEEAVESPAAEESPVAQEEEEDGGISGTLLTLIIVGVLLVAGGIVGIIFLLRSGKDDDDDKGVDDLTDAPPAHTPTIAQTGNPGVYSAGPAPGGDAPTMIHNGPLVQDDDLAGYGGAPAPGFGPAYGGAGSDATQVMPLAGPQPGPYPPAADSDHTQVLPTANDHTRVAPAPASPYADRAPAPTPPPPPAPSPVPQPAPQDRSTSMFAPHNPDLMSGSQQQPSRDPYAPQDVPQGRDGHVPPNQGGYGQQQSNPYGQPNQSGPSGQPSQPGPGGYGQQADSYRQPGSADAYGTQGRDPYAPQGQDPYAPPAQPSPATPPPSPSQYSPQQYSPPPPPNQYGSAPEPYAPQPTRAMPQPPPQPQQPSPQPPANPYETPGQQPNHQAPGQQNYQPPGQHGYEPPAAGEQPREEPDEEPRRNWGEWDDRPRSW